MITRNIQKLIIAHTKYHLNKHNLFTKQTSDNLYSMFYDTIKIFKKIPNITIDYIWVFGNLYNTVCYCADLKIELEFFQNTIEITYQTEPPYHTARYPLIDGLRELECINQQLK